VNLIVSAVSLMLSIFTGERKMKVHVVTSASHLSATPPARGLIPSPTVAARGQIASGVSPHGSEIAG
jgi:hypothetical protein